VSWVEVWKKAGRWAAGENVENAEFNQASCKLRLLSSNTSSIYCHKTCQAQRLLVYDWLECCRYPFLHNKPPTRRSIY
jgi:hypothetical protein